MFPSGDGVELINLSLKVCKNIICIFPRNICKQQIRKLSSDNNIDCLIEDIHLFGKHKMTIIYFGPLFNNNK